jgi:hypothetical protein
MSAGKVFLSYRRDDTAGHAGRLFDRLNAHFPNRIFMDVVGLEPGADFVDEIDRAVGSCQVLIALIGKQWLTIRDSSGRRRLDRSDDFVRLEVGIALRRNIRVVPALVGDAPFPPADSLPKDLVPLCRRNALRLNDASFDHDVGRLIRALEKELAGRETPNVNRFRIASFSGMGIQRRALPLGLAALAAGAVFTTFQVVPEGGDPPATGSISDRSAMEPSTQRGTVKIQLTDGGVAAAYREGKYVGSTPFDLSGRVGEKIQLTFRRSGFRDHQRTFNIGEILEYNVTMEREE